MIFFVDNKKHKKPHIHVKYQKQEAAIAIHDGELLEGEMDRSGYRKKPKYIYLIGILYFLFPFITLYQFYLNVGHSFELLKELIFSKFYLLELFFSFTAGIAVLAVTRIGFFYFIAVSIYTLRIKAYNLQCYSVLEYPFDCLIILSLFAATSLLFFTNLRIPYLNPKTRWWKQPLRYSHKMHGILTLRSIKFPVVTLNLSMTGIFLKLDEVILGKDENIKEQFINFLHKHNVVVGLEINVIPEAGGIFQQDKFYACAKVAWYSEKDSAHKYGLGIQFINQSAKEKRRLKQYIRLLKTLHLGLER